MPAARLGRVVAGAHHHERHAGGLVVEVEPLLVEPAVRAEELAVVARAHQQGMLGAALGDRSPHPVERAVDLGVEAVVQVAVLLGVGAVGVLDDRRRPVARRVRRPVGGLRCRLVDQVLVVGR